MRAVIKDLVSPMRLAMSRHLGASDLAPVVAMSQHLEAFLLHHPIPKTTRMMLNANTSFHCLLDTI